MLTRYADSLNEWRGWSALARQQTGKSIPAQLREIRALRGMGGQCGMSDYYCYKLYDDSYQLGRGARDFLGWRLESSLGMALNPRHAVLPAWDKLAFTALAGAAGLPIVPLRAYYHRAQVVPAAQGEHLKTPEEVGAFLRDPANFPLFAKPAFSQQGKGAEYLSGYERSGDLLRILGGASMPVDEFLRRLTVSIDPRYHRPECGFVFQSPLAPAPEIRALTNWAAICGVRIICLNGPEGAKPVAALWKIAVPPNHVDNFSKGKYGNLLASINLDDGRVTRTLTAFWPNTAIHATHPLTGAQLEGFKVPGWEQVLEACRQGGAAFPLMRIHHWDFALTDQGPLILELNDLGMTIGPQIHGRGLLTEEMRGFLRRHANPAAHPWTRGL